jgi:hypothetical protein
MTRDHRTMELAGNFRRRIKRFATEGFKAGE